MDNKNTIKVYTSYSGAELSISAPSVKQVITATNNRAQYFAEQAKKYRDEAKMHRDNAKYYAELALKYAFGEDLADSIVIGVKGENESDYRVGKVNLTAENIGAISSTDIATVDEIKNYLGI